MLFDLACTQAGLRASSTPGSTTCGQHACMALHAAATHRPHPACGTRASWEWLWQARRLGAPTRRPRARLHSAGPARPWLCTQGKRVSPLASLSKSGAKSSLTSRRRAPATARAAATEQHTICTSNIKPIEKQAAGAVVGSNEVTCTHSVEPPAPPLIPLLPRPLPALQEATRKRERAGEAGGAHVRPEGSPCSAGKGLAPSAPAPVLSSLARS